MTFRDRVGAAFLAALDLFLAKNSDYGNSFEEVADRFTVTGHDPMLAMLPRILDKSGRLENLVLADHAAEVDESIIDTLKDLGTYAFMTAAYLAGEEEAIDLEARLAPHAPSCEEPRYTITPAGIAALEHEKIAEMVARYKAEKL